MGVAMLRPGKFIIAKSSKNKNYVRTILLQRGRLESASMLRFNAGGAGLKGLQMSKMEINIYEMVDQWAQSYGVFYDLSNQKEVDDKTSFDIVLKGEKEVYHITCSKK